MNFLTFFEIYQPLIFAKLSDMISGYYLQEDLIGLGPILGVNSSRKRVCMFSSNYELKFDFFVKKQD